ncbi:MAG: SRPBCC family protein [Ignavibacteriae bacterium]|nr:SRPBCC family protein [Ignavibacteriota bacterium]
MDKTKIKIETFVSADENKVWEYWTQPEHITKWNFASDDWHCPSTENDLRVGGKFSSRMEAKDGSFGFDFWGIYDEVIPQKKISYTMGDGRKAITDFEQQNDEIKITTIFDAESENSIELQKFGWQSILNNFKKLVEEN